MKASESASDTTTLCLSLSEAARVKISIQDIDIAHCIPITTPLLVRDL